jgi:transcriptional regulator with XRE-family HTH domain
MASDLIKALKSLPLDSKRRVRVALAYLDETQTGLSQATGIDRSVLSTALSGYRTLTADQQIAIANVLHVPVSVLFPKVAA